MIEAGVRVANSVVLEKAVLQERSCVLDSILCWGVHVGKWARVEGELWILPYFNILLFLRD